MVHDAESVFGPVAELYDRVRTAYPAPLVADVVELAALDSDGEILEIGCGTGKATRLFAEYGRRMTCVDASKRMLDVARRTCARFQHVRFVEAKFEDWSPGGTRFDLVLAAQAWHWIEPAVGYGRVAEILKPGGLFAIIWNSRSEGIVPSLRDELDAIYERYADLRSPGPGSVTSLRFPSLISASGRFGNPWIRRYAWESQFDTETWIQFLTTTSDHRTLAPARREALLTSVREAIDRHGGIYRFTMESTVLAAKRV